MHRSARWAGAVLVCALAGCATQGSQEEAGMVIGSLVGGIVGAQVGEGSGRTAATIIGAMTGMVVGGTIGRSMDEQDRRKTAHTLETVRSGVPSYWRNPDSGHQYRVTPRRTFETPQGPCREYTVDGVIGGRPETLVGTACRQADGSWRVRD